MSNTVKWVLGAVIGILLLCSCLCLAGTGIYNFMLKSIEETTEVSIYWGYTTNPPDFLKAFAPDNTVWLADLEDVQEYVSQYGEHELAYRCLNPEDERVLSVSVEQFKRVSHCEQGNVYVLK